MPNNTSLLSIDFGGNFTYERNAFKKFNIYSVSTNFRDLNYERAHWTFMGVAAILYAEALNIKWHSFGTILEAHFLNHCNQNLVSKFSGSKFLSTNMIESGFVKGLTEVGTALVVAFYMPETLRETLYATSRPNSEKFLRKKLIIDAVLKQRGEQIDLSIPFKDIKLRPTKFGTNFVVDFLSLYFYKILGLQSINIYIEGIPNEILTLVDGMSLNFYEKINPIALNRDIPPEFLEQYLKKLNIVGIEPYNQQDWDEYLAVLKMINIIK